MWWWWWWWGGYKLGMGHSNATLLEYRLVSCAN